MNVEITIPVLNEEKTVYNQVKILHSYISKNFPDPSKVVIVIADNGSTDGTKQIAQSLVEELVGVEYLGLDRRGVGLALKASWSKSDADIVGYMDLDLATNLDYLLPALNLLNTKNVDIVTGSRLAKGSKVIGRSFIRTFTSNCFNLLVKLSFSTSFTDGMCGFKFINRTIFEHLEEGGAKSDGWFFATQILIVGEYLNYKIYDLPIIWTDTPDSKVKIFRLSSEYIREIIQLKKQLK